MLVHGMRTAEELPKIVKADIQANREPNRRPHAIPATDPGLEPEHVPCINTKLRNFFLVRRKRNEMFSNMGFVFGRFEKLLLSRFGIGTYLCDSERFAGDEEQRSRGVR